MTYIIRLPWPPAKSSPNGSQRDFHGKARAGKAYKEACAWECKIRDIKPVDFDTADVTITFFPPDKRRRDLDNLLASAKRGLDAVSEAIGVDDGKWHRVTLERGPVVGNGCLLVQVQPYTAERRVTVPLEGQIS